MALTDKLTAIADAIRTRTGATNTLTLAEMPNAILNIGAGFEFTNYEITRFEYTSTDGIASGTKVDITGTNKITIPSNKEYLCILFTGQLIYYRDYDNDISGVYGDSIRDKITIPKKIIYENGKLKIKESWDSDVDDTNYTVGSSGNNLWIISDDDTFYFESVLMFC